MFSHCDDSGKLFVPTTFICKKLRTFVMHYVALGSVAAHYVHMTRFGVLGAFMAGRQLRSNLRADIETQHAAYRSISPMYKAHDYFATISKYLESSLALLSDDLCCSFIGPPCIETRGGLLLFHCQPRMISLGEPCAHSCSMIICAF